MLEPQTKAESKTQTRLVIRADTVEGEIWYHRRSRSLSACILGPKSSQFSGKCICVGMRSDLFAPSRHSKSLPRASADQLVSLMAFDRSLRMGIPRAVKAAATEFSNRSEVFAK